MIADNEVWPDYLMIRDTGLHDDMGGLGQRIHTTAGAGYKKVKYVRADIAERDAAEIVRLRGEVDGLRRELCEAHGNVYIAPAEAKGDGLWSLHVLGPDEVHAAPSKAHAEQAVAIFNATFPHGDGEAMCEAVVAPWPHSDKSHAESVAEFIPNWLLPRWQVEALTKNTPQPADGGAVAWMTPGGDVSRSLLWCEERCLPGQKPAPLYTAPVQVAPQEVGPTGFRFGLGGIAVSTGSIGSDKEPAVFLREVAETGEVGKPVKGTELRAILAFPTVEQMQRVADALVNAAHPSACELGAKWISVDDRLPTEADYGEHDRVLVRYRYTDIPGREWSIGDSLHDADEHSWNNGWLFGSCNYAEVSHWMPFDTLLSALHHRGDSRGGEG